MSSKNVTFKQVVIVFAVVFCIGAFGILYPIFKYSRPIWPVIDNPSKLLEDCNSLLRDDPDLIKDMNDWPESVKNLHPRFVFADKDFINITLSLGGITYVQSGYIVYPDKRSKPDTPSDFIIRGSICDGIFKYECDINNPKRKL